MCHAGCEMFCRHPDRVIGWKEWDCFRILQMLCTILKLHISFDS